MGNVEKLCRCGYYCPSGSSSMTQEVCKDTRSSRASSLMTVYCPKGSSKPLHIHNGNGYGYIPSEPAGNNVNGPFCNRKKTPAGRYSTDQTLIKGNRNGKKCPAGRYGPKSGLQACTKMCTSGYYCPVGSIHDKVQVCGQGMTGNRYESTYAAKVYAREARKQYSKLANLVTIRLHLIKLVGEQTWAHKRMHILINVVE